jgi:hypothetical protein
MHSITNLSFLKKVGVFLAERKWIFIFFFVFLCFQVVESGIFFWDPFVYLLNGKWFCGQAFYFEYLRPPFPAVADCLLGASDFSPLFSSILASFLYLIAGLMVFNKFCEKKGQPAFALLFFLFPSILLFSNFGGDLFALSFLLIAFCVSSPVLKGGFFSLAALSRYNYIFYCFIFMWQFRKKPFAFAQFVLASVLLWAPWFLFNYLFTGNPFFSLEETVYLNVFKKGVLVFPDFAQCLVLLLFFVTFALVFINHRRLREVDFFALIGVIMFLTSGIKESRFLNVVAPFLSINLSNIPKNAVIFVALLAVLFSGYFVYLSFNQPPVLQIPKYDYINSCKVMSDRWVYFYKFGVVAEPLPGTDSFDYFLSHGTTLVIYDLNSLNFNKNKYDILFDSVSNSYIIRSNYCAAQDKNYVLKVWRG